MKARQYRAFTLVELLIVVSVIGVLAMIAYPSYEAYVLKVRRTDAKQSLTWFAQQLERCYTRQRSYASLECPQVTNANAPTFSATSRDGHYAVSSRNADGFEALAQETFSLYAVPQGNQAKDTLCSSFRIDNNLARGARSNADDDTTDLCW